MKKILPVHFPVITASPDDTNHLSVLETVDQSKEWLYNNYIQLAGRVGLSESDYPIFFAFGTEFMGRPYLACPWIKTNILSANLLDKSLDICTCIMQYIDENCYITIDVNQKYFQCFMGYQEVDFRHSVFIYGYDLQEKMFYVADFFEYGKYSFETVSFEELRQAYYHRFDGEICDDLDDDNIVLFQLRNSPRNVIETAATLDIKRIIYSLEEYLGLQKHNVVSYSSDKFIYGVSLYGELIKRINRVIEDDIWLHKKAFHVLYQHKLLMTLRIVYINQRFCLPNFDTLFQSASAIEKNAECLRNLVIKFSLTQNKKILFTIRELLSCIYKKECEYIPDLINSLKSIIDTNATTK